MTRTTEPLEIVFPTGQLRGVLSFSGSYGHSAVVYVHGLGGHRAGVKSAALEAECARRGWTFIACDFRGHGESSGSTRELTGSRLLEDLQQLETCARQKGITRLFLVGSSMGGWATAWFSQSAPTVQRMVLLAPAFRFLYRRWDSLSEEQLENWRRTGLLRLANDWIDIELGYELIAERGKYLPDALRRSWNKPTLLFHGLADNVVPYQETLEFVQDNPAPSLELRLLNHGDHRLTSFEVEIAQEACRWFACEW